ncbi:MAG: ATP-binding cassette domain-containing protein [Deltaproteobacteria bacterium]|nr:ATP-binding cassette domain-containing protein [Deltaproteobacteria bacterium]MBW2338756.1 ATP-binding cassette domain-containing protein [Deltaproteobacteria bacterium]
MIHVENLTKYFNDLCAVDQITFDIQKGEILGLLGPNGAGKTTFLRMLTGYLAPTLGTIRVKDYIIDEHLLEIKKLLGYLPESAPLYHDMLAYDYLNYIADVRELRSEQKLSRIRRLADLCGLNEVMHQPIGELSKGYKQRVGLAHAMMSDPEILVLDEPTSGLDPNQIVEIREIIKKIGKKKTIIISTHILSEAEAACDRIIIINRGRIVADGSTEAIKQTASGEYLVNISLQSADSKSVERELSSIEGVVDIGFSNGEENILGVRLTCKSSADIRGEIYRRIKQTDWILLEFHQERRSLENIFRRLTQEN